MDKQWKHYPSWKRLDTKGHLLHDSIYLKYTKQEDVHWTTDQKLGEGEPLEEG